MVMTTKVNPANGVNGEESASDANLTSPGSRAVETQADGGRHPITGRAKRRMWSRADNTKVLKCYFASLPMERGFQERMWNIWKNLGGFEVSKNRLAMQVDCIKRKKWFSDLGKEEIRTESTGVQREEEQPLSQEPALTEPDVTIEVIRRPEEVDVQEVPPPKEFETVVNDIRDRRQRITTVRRRLPPLRAVERRVLMAEVRRINYALPYVEISTITEMNDTIRACAEIVTEKVRPCSTRKSTSTPWWQKRLNRKLAETRKGLSRVVEAEKRNWNDPFKRTIESKYNIKKKGYKVVEEELKQRVKAIAARIKDYCERSKQYRNNKMFVNNQGQFFKSLKASKTEKGQAPNKEESEAFWKGIWENETSHDSSGRWLREIKEEFRTVENQSEMSITEEMVRKVTVKMPNWKAPGPDGV